MALSIVTKSEKVPILGIFSPKTILMFRVGLKKIRVGRPTGTTHTFHLSLRFKVQVNNISAMSDSGHLPERGREK